MAYPRNSDSVAADQLRAFVERVERIEEDIKALNTDKSELYAEAKGNGFDVPTIKKVVRIRKMDEADRQEADAMLALYLSALGMATPDSNDEYSTPLVHVHARVENIDEFDAETGEITESTAERMDAPNQNADGQSALNAVEAGTQAPPVDIISGLAGPALVEDAPPANIKPAPISEPALVPREIAEPGDRGASSLAATVVPTIRPHNPGTHFLNKDNLMRLHGCLVPDMCASSTPRVKLCSTCTAKLGPVAA